jgi:hypothetical protein
VSCENAACFYKKLFNLKGERLTEIQKYKEKYINDPTFNKFFSSLDNK